MKFLPSLTRLLVLLAMPLAIFLGCSKQPDSGVNTFSVNLIHYSLDTTLVAGPDIDATYGEGASGLGELSANVLFPGNDRSEMAFTLFDTMKINQSYQMPYTEVYFGLTGSWLGSSSTLGYSSISDSSKNQFQVTITSWKNSGHDRFITGTFSTGILANDSVGEFHFSNGHFKIYYTF